MNLSKSKFCLGIQCHKILWLDRNMPEQSADETTNDDRMETGNQVGALAMEYFGEYKEVPFTTIPEMLTKTGQLLEEGANVIAEASFSHDGNFCSVDLLRKIPRGYEIVEVKSSTASQGDTSDTVKPIYIHDMAYQFHVLTQCGINVTKATIMQINRDYIRQGELNIKHLFALIDCTNAILAMQEDMPRRIQEIKNAAMQKNEPEIDISGHCNNPYECAYKSWCFRHLPKNNVFNIGWSMWGSKKEEAYKSGFLSFEDVIAGGVRLSEKQNRQIMTELYNLPPQIDKTALCEFLSGIRYPLYHLDFETFQQAVPLWDDVSPYVQIPFQYSIHIQDKPCGEATHKEFLAKEGQDPRRTLAEQLCADIPIGVCVIVYSMGFEKGRIKELANLFPDLADRLLSINDNMVDLAAPFRSGAYYCRKMGGSYSIKSVLPALFPNAPELDYKALEIQNGITAMTVYATLHEQSADEIAKTRQALLDYCRLDTYAMVKVLGKLYEVSS